ncbi:MAG: glycosyltransferase family 9 protein, partial [Candidatus Kapaibacterium sp.]
MNLPNIKKISKILIIRLSSMGDVILSSALVRSVRSACPDAMIDFAVAKQFAGSVEYNPRISNIFKYDKSLEVKEILRRRDEFMKSNGIDKYDVVFDLQNNLRSRIFTRGIADNISRIDKRRLYKLALVHMHKIISPPRHVADIYMDAARPFGVTDDGRGLELWLPDESGDYPPEARRQCEQPRSIAIAPGAHHFTKRWPAEKFARLADRLAERYGASIATFGGAADVDICRFIISLARANIRDLSGSTSIARTASRLDEYDLLVTNDTGMMHIAAARRVPVVAIFGSTVPELGFAPWGTLSQIVRTNLRCQPCTHIGREDCPKGHFRCMLDLNPVDIIPAIEK